MNAHCTFKAQINRPCTQLKSLYVALNGDHTPSRLLQRNSFKGLFSHAPQTHRHQQHGLSFIPKAEASVSSSQSPAPNDKKKFNVGGFLTAASLAAVTIGAYLLLTSPTPPQELMANAVSSVKHLLSSSVLAKSGFFAAFSLIFASEIGDKTFFIAALLAMRVGKMVSFVGSVASLSVMTVISVAIGYAVKSVPAAVKSSEVLGQWLGAALLLYFGIRTIKQAWSAPDGVNDGEELEEAEQSVAQADSDSHMSKESPWRALVEVASLIFVAEWGDRSMLATIALGAAQSPVGVAGGAILGHTVATAIAVIGGAVLSKHISEKTVGFVGGGLFIVFAAATMFGLF